MTATAGDPTYKVWAADDVVYGPVPHAVVLEWIAEQRIVAGMWLYPMEQRKWVKAGDLAELQRALADALAAGLATPSAASPLVQGVPAGALRKVALLSSMNDQQLGRFAQFMTVAKVAKFDAVVSQGETGDAMYIVLAGSLRVRQLVAGKETVISTLREGDVFGEISLFDQGPRSADVLANEESTLLVIGADRFGEFTRKMPEVALSFLLAISRTMARRIRADNERHKQGLLVLQSAPYH